MQAVGVFPRVMACSRFDRKEPARFRETTFRGVLAMIPRGPGPYQARGPRETPHDGRSDRGDGDDGEPVQSHQAGMRFRWPYG